MAIHVCNYHCRHTGKLLSSVQGPALIIEIWRMAEVLWPIETAANRESTYSYL